MSAAMNEEQQAAQADLSSLGRVSHRLAMIDSAVKLESVLDKLLPRLLQRVGSNHQKQAATTKNTLLYDTLAKIHAKLVEIFSHVMKRVRDDRSVKLNCHSILELLLLSTLEGGGNDKTAIIEANPSIDPFTLNLALAFLTLTLSRCDEQELQSLLPGLIVLHGYYAQQALAHITKPTIRSHWHQISHLLLRALELSSEYQQKQQQATIVSKKPKLTSPPSVSPVNTPPGAVAATATASGYVDAIHTVLRYDKIAMAALYDLLLDVLFYQTTAPNSVPPPGCSQAGQERLQSNKTWAQEMIPPARLSLLKTRLLLWISPTKQSCLFPDHHEHVMTLLLAALGDSSHHPQVANEAGMYRKQYLENLKQVYKADSDGGNDSENNNNYKQHLIHLMMELLILCVGSNNAMIAMSSSALPPISLGLLGQESSSQPTPPQQDATVMPFRRRMVSKDAFAVMVSHVNIILTDQPHLFAQHRQLVIPNVGTLAILASSTMLAELHTSNGLTVLRGKPYVSAAQVLNSFVIRVLSSLEEQPPADGSYQKRLESLLAKALALACTSLSSTVANISASSSSSSTTTAISSEGNISVRDALYGVICALARAKNPYSWLFALGKQEVQESISIATAKLLFSCIVKEEKSLWPRATAALDALLAAYCRTASVINTKKSQSEQPQAVNPWSANDSNTSTAASAMDLDSPNVEQRKQLAKSLLPLLWSASQYTQTKASRLAGARWSADLLMKLDLTNACHILCFLAGDNDVTVASIARRGLELDNDSQANNISKQLGEGHGRAEGDDKADEASKLGDFSALTRLLFSKIQATNSAVWRPTFWEFQPKAKASSIAYLLKCLLNDFYGGDDESVYAYVDAMTQSLMEVANLGKSYVDLLDECASCLSVCLSTSLFARRLIFEGSNHEPRLSFGLGDMEGLVLNLSSSSARRDLAEACGYIYGDTSLWKDEEWLLSIVRMMETCLQLLKDSNHRSGQLGSVHGAAFLGATCVKHYRLNPLLASSGKGWEMACQILSALGRGTTVADDFDGKAFTDALLVALSYNKESGGDAPQLVQCLHEGATTALSDLASSLRKYSGDDHTDVSRVSKVVQSMGVCLEATIPISGGEKKNNTELHAARLDCVDSLLSLIGSAAYRKHEEIALEAGEALAAYAWVPKGVVWDSSVSVMWPAELDMDFAKTLPPHQQIVYTLLRGSKVVSNPLKRTAHGPVLLALVARAAGRVNHDSSYAQTSLVQEISSHLPEVQSSFISILADPKSKHLCRESCCLGLAACRSLAKLSNTGEEVNDKLLRAFGQTTNFGTSAMQETQDQANRRRREEGRSNDGDTVEGSRMESEVGGTSGMSEAALGAYREMAAAAVSLGRPDILYALFMLCVTHPVWFSKGGRERYGPYALLGENSIIGSRTNAAGLRQALRPHLGKIIPRLLRASHDPNKQTREQIKNLWNGLTGGGAEARLAVSQHLLPIMDSLFVDTSHKLWRARVGATGALAQVIVGRSWTELGGGPAVLDDDDIFSNAPNVTGGTRLLKLWFISVRALDDVRAAVRESGETLARGVRSLTIRLCDPLAIDESQCAIIDKKGHLRDSSAAAATALRWLIKNGLNQPCPEATGVCVSCLVGVITVVNPSILQPLIPDLLRSLLLAMSSLEPAALNYLQVRAAGQGTDAESSYGTIERLRLQVAQTGPLAMAVTKLLDMVPQVDLNTQRAIIPQLNSALNQSAGFTTRAAVADACSTLCSSCPNAFKFSGLTSTNPSVGLLRGFYHGAERESGAAARSKMAHAFGSLASLCPGSSVRALALRACNNYNSATGANHDSTIRLSAAIALRSIAVRAQNQFSDGGNNDIWCKRVLPVSYLGMRDSDQKIAQLWKEVWEEGGSAANLAGAVDDFSTIIEEKLLVFLVKECSMALTDVSWSRRTSGAAALKALADARILAPIPHKKEFSKSIVLSQELERFHRRSLSSHLALTSLVKLFAANRLWSGKSGVAEAAAKIAANWSSDRIDSEIMCNTDNHFLTPICLAAREQDDDLFIGDDWFGHEHEEDETDGDSIEKPEASTSLLEDTNFDSDTADLNDADEIGLEHTQGADSLTQISFIGLCRLLVVQSFPTARALLSVSEDEVLPYRAAVLQSLTDLLNSLGESIDSDALKRCVFQVTSEKLLSVFTSPADSEGNLKEPPFFIARSLDCFATAFWNGIGSDEDEVDTMALSKLFFQCLEQPAWTVRESACLCCSSLVLKSHAIPLRHYETISIMVACVSRAAKDRKFWRVRLAGIQLLHSLVDRAGKINGSTSDRERQELLESMLPHKEQMLKLAKQSLGDPEAKVTALAGEIIKAMTWWP